jgi:hypothetical protein
MRAGEVWSGGFLKGCRDKCDDEWHEEGACSVLNTKQLRESCDLFHQEWMTHSLQLHGPSTHLRYLSRDSLA